MKFLNSEKETLSKEQMKKVLGGDIPPDGDGPSVPESDGLSSGSGGAGYKCCWANTTNCSDCVPQATSQWVCKANGSVLTAC